MNEAGQSREALLSKAFVELADTLVDDYDIIALLDRLAGYCVELLSADAAGILLADAHHKLRVVASTNEQTAWMELLQLQADEGPCVECFRTATPVSVVDLSETAKRWPRFTTGLATALADREPYRSVHALPLRLRGEPIGALNLFHRQPGPLPAADLALGQAMADVATIGILSERAINRGEVLNEQLQTALNSRVIIEQAKGVLAERGNIDMDSAFDRLRRYSRDHNLKLSDVGRQIVESGLAPAVLGRQTVRKAPPRRP
jgi:GAF domain-containing protein